MINKLSPAQGTLLISEPFMADANFKRSVVLLVEHKPEGSLGFIINHKSEYLLNDIIPDCWDANFMVYTGGPVAVDTLHFIHKIPNKIPNSIDLGNGLYWGGDFESLKIQINNYNIKEDEIRFFIGYSGWNDGQLYDELLVNSWIVSNKYNPDMIFDDSEADLWKEAIINMGQKYAHIANFPMDPALN